MFLLCSYIQSFCTGYMEWHDSNLWRGYGLYVVGQCCNTLWSQVMKICCIFQIKLKQYENVCINRKWYWDNKRFSELFATHCVRKTAVMDMGWRYYIGVTLCMASQHMESILSSVYCRDLVWIMNISSCKLCDLFYSWHL